MRLIIAVHLEPVLDELWAEAWRENDETAGGYYEAWAAIHGRDSDRADLRLQAAEGQQGDLRTPSSQAAALTRSSPSWRGCWTSRNRAEMIAVTETGRAATAAAITRYRAQGTTYKEWWTAGDGRVCFPACRKAQDEGAIPLDSLFANGFIGPPAHPRCRCDLVPAVTHGVTLKATYWRDNHDGTHTPVPLASKQESIHGTEHDVHCARGHKHHGEHGAAGLLIRHKGDDGKYRYLLQKRSPDEDDPGTWSLPGGALLAGESVIQGAFRECQEEMGSLPLGVSIHHHVVDAHGPSTYAKGAGCPLHGSAESSESPPAS